jgi:hypothetical protein
MRLNRVTECQYGYFVPLDLSPWDEQWKTIGACRYHVIARTAAESDHRRAWGTNREMAKGCADTPVMETVESWENEVVWSYENVTNTTVGELKNRETHAGKWQTPVARYLPWYKRVERQVLTTAAFLQTNASGLGSRCLLHSVSWWTIWRCFFEIVSYNATNPCLTSWNCIFWHARGKVDEMTKVYNWEPPDCWLILICRAHIALIPT